MSIASIAIAVDGSAYILLDHPETSSGSPLFRIVSDAWVPQQCTGLPTETRRQDLDPWYWSNFYDRYRKLVAHPFDAGVLFVSYGARVYRLSSQRFNDWDWTDISENLPGQWVYDLWIGNISGQITPAGAAGRPGKVLLRAAVVTSGVWETDLTDETGAFPRPYLRKNILDQGWLDRCPDGESDPYDPANQVWHYQCADIKIDVQQPGSADTPTFFQTDATPISHVLFDQLRDNSQNLPGSTAAYVHVQVRNRSYKPANVHVWAIWCNAAAGVPALNVRKNGDTFDFWSRFDALGGIDTQLPDDSPWHSVGMPQTLTDIDANSPKVASWPWAVPTLDSGDPGHYCIVAFVHSVQSPINESSNDVDAIAPVNPQVGQKNLHVIPPLPADVGGEQTAAATGGAGAQMHEYVEFHNPTAVGREASLVFDLRRLPPEIQVKFQLTKLQTVNPLPASLSGIAEVYPATALQQVICLAECLLKWLSRFLQWLGCCIENLGRWLLGLPPRSCPSISQLTSAGFRPTAYTSWCQTRGQTPGRRESS